MNGTWLVTGGSGFVGRHLLDECHRRGIGVRALVRPTSRRDALGRAQPVVGDLASGRGLQAAVEGADVVVHVAGLVKALEPGPLFEVNEGGTRRLIEACLGLSRPPRRFVLVSSLAAAGPSHWGRPTREDDPDRPISHYGRSKLASEQVATSAASEMEIVIVRPCAVYGPHDRETFQIFEGVAKRLFPLIRGASERLSMIDVSDLARGIAEAALSEVAAGRTYYLSHSEVLSVESIADTIAVYMHGDSSAYRKLRLPGGLVRLAAAVTHAGGRLLGRVPSLNLLKIPELLATDWSCSPERALRDFRWEAKIPTSIGLPRAAWWFKENGWL